MTPEQLAAIAARNAARTPGKWTQHLVDDTTVVCRGQDICCTFPGGGLDDDVDFNTDTEQRELDAAFIAHASEDIPSLLAEVARLTAEKQEAEQRGYDAAKEQAAKWHDGEADYNSGVLQAEESDSVCRGFFADALTFHRDSAKELRAMVRP